MSAQDELQVFPANIDFVYVEAAHFESRTLPSFLKESETASKEPGEWMFEGSYKPAGERMFLVRLKATADFKCEPDEQPYDLYVEIVAGIRVAESVDQSFVDKWITKGANFLLVPYARAAIANLMQGSGFRVPHLPLLALPILYAEGTATDPPAAAADSD